MVSYNTSMIIPLYKPIGPSTHAFVKKFADSIGKIATHTGSLDPLADGVVIVLTDDDRFRKEEESSVSKEYTFRVLGGFSTDSHDVLGIISKTLPVSVDIYNQIVVNLSHYSGTYLQKVPDFSARRINGESAFDFAKRGEKIEEKIEEVFILGQSVTGVTLVSEQHLLRDITDRISCVKGSFRQADIIKGWEEVLYKTDRQFPLVECSVVVSKRMYVRGLVRDLSEDIGVPLTTLSITRIKNGKYSIDDCTVFE